MDKNKFTQNKALKKRLKIIGFSLLSIGGIFVIIAFIDFFTVVGSMSGMPKLFFLFFVGFPFIAGGVACLNFGYMGEVSRYTSNEISPVAKDTINYLLDGTKDQLSDTLNTINNSNTIKEKFCPKCHHENDKDAKYCDNCGGVLFKNCSYCAEENDSDAKFCKSCGKELK